MICRGFILKNVHSTFLFCFNATSIYQNPSFNRGWVRQLRNSFRPCRLQPLSPWCCWSVHLNCSNDLLLNPLIFQQKVDKRWLKTFFFSVVLANWEVVLASDLETWIHQSWPECCYKHGSSPLLQSRISYTFSRQFRSISVHDKKLLQKLPFNLIKGNGINSSLDSLGKFI